MSHPPLPKKMLLQGLQQLAGIPYIHLSHLFRLPGVAKGSKITYSLPFEGAWAVVNGSVIKEFSHSWGLPTQRYAYDFLILDEEGHSYSGEQQQVEAYHCYGKSILAPADGVVVQVGEGCSDMLPFINDEVAFSADDIRGNYLLIRHAKKEYSFIGHIKPGSICVAVGETVQRGQPIAQCGNTGNTSEPHLHFHLQDGTGAFTNAGIPIRFIGIRAETQPGYAVYDSRPVPSVTVQAGELSYLSRGQRAENQQ